MAPSIRTAAPPGERGKGVRGLTQNAKSNPTASGGPTSAMPLSSVKPRKTNSTGTPIDASFQLYATRFAIW